MKTYECADKRILLGTNGKTIMFIHGAWGSLHQFDWYADTLHKEGYTTYQLSLPFHTKGHEKELSRISILDYVKVVQQEIAHITEHITLIGHSMGGIICQRVAAELPEKVAKLVLIASAPPRGILLWNPKMMLQVISTWCYLKAMIFGGPLSVLPKDQNVFLFNTFENKTRADFWKKQLLPESGKALLQLSTFSVGIKKIHCPVLLFSSPEDNLVPYKTSVAMRRKYNGRLVPMTGGHYFFLEEISRGKIMMQLHYFLCK